MLSSLYNYIVYIFFVSVAPIVHLFWIQATQQIIIIIIIIFLLFFNPRINEGGEKLRKIQRSLKWKKLVLMVLRGKTVVQQYGVKTLNGNRNALK